MVPGEDITAQYPHLIEEVRRRMSPPGFDLLRDSTLTDPSVLQSPQLAGESDFYVLETRPGKTSKRLPKHTLYLLPRDELVAFVAANFNRDRGEGLDITISTRSMDRIIICNHDGDMFLLP